MKKQLLRGLMAGGLVFAMAAPAIAQDYSGSINGSLNFHGPSDPSNVSVVTVKASGDPTDARGRYQYRVTYRDSSGTVLTQNVQGQVTCFARIGNRAYVEYQVTKVIGVGGLQVGYHYTEAWEDNSATGDADRYTFGGLGFPDSGHCADEFVVSFLDGDLDVVLPGLVTRGNIIIR
jgi:hypothetical protein